MPLRACMTYSTWICNAVCKGLINVERSLLLAYFPFLRKENRFIRLLDLCVCVCEYAYVCMYVCARPVLTVESLCRYNDSGMKFVPCRPSHSCNFNFFAIINNGMTDRFFLWGGNNTGDVWFRTLKWCMMVEILITWNFFNLMWRAIITDWDLQTFLCDIYCLWI
jgi:hypothetical protein